MARKGAFTIVAKNYIGLASILRDSVVQRNPDVAFHIFVADEFENSAEPLDNHIHIARRVLDYPDEQWTTMAFQYNLTEFCTAIKPACFQYLFSQGYTEVLFFDPDIYTFAPLTSLFSRLNEAEVILTPHVVETHVRYHGDQPEWTFNCNGIYNLGFCGLKDSPAVRTFLDWWRVRMDDNAFTDRSVGNFTDQKWMDWVPALFADQLCVVRDLGVNVAPWNYFEREIVSTPDGLCVRSRTDADSPLVPLVFVHFSGYSYTRLIEGTISHQRLNISSYADIDLINDAYRKAITEQLDTFNKYIGLTYSYGTYANGRTIDAFHRRLYHGLLTEGEMVGNPFAVGDGTFYARLEHSHLLADTNSDRFTPQNYPDMKKNVTRLNRFYQLLFRLIGYKRYPLFLKSMLAVYCRPENHTFLLKKK